MEQYKGKEILIKRPAMGMFNLFSDLRNIASSVPEDVKARTTFEEDRIVSTVQGITLGVRVDQRVPFSLISLVDDGQSPFHFRFNFHFITTEEDYTLFHLELEAELNTMMKMMIGGKMQKMVDKISDQIEEQISRLS